MGDRVSRLVLTFDGEAGTIESVLNGIKGSVRNAVADMERTASKINLFADLETKVKASAEALFDATTKVKLLGVEFDRIKATGAKVPELISIGMKAAKEDVDKATAAYNKNVDALTKMQTQLTKAGVDTSNLARAQLQLADATRKAAAAAEDQAAKQLLGVKTLADIQPQIAKLNSAFATLRDSGKLSANEVAIAQKQLQLRIAETRGEVTKLSGGFAGIGSGVSSLLTGFAARFLGVGVVIGTVTEAMRAGIAAAKDYKQAIAEIGTVTNLSKEELDALGKGARELATRIGFDLQEGLKALFELIRSGVPKENALEALAISAEAAKASLTDIGTTSKITTLLLDGFGLEVSDLRGAFDKLVQGAHDGGANFREFAESAGPLLNVARAARIPFDDLVATLTVMTDASNDAAGSTAALTKIILKLGDPEVRGKLKALGIESTSLVDIFRELGQRGIPLQQFIDLGIASTKTAAGVSALTNSTGKLAPELDKIRGAAGETEKAVTALYDSPKERAARFDAAIHESAVQLGELVGSSSRLASVATSVINFLNGVGRASRGGAVEGTIADNALSRYIARLFGVEPAAASAVKGADAAAAALKKAGEAAAITEGEIRKANTALGDSATKLLTEVQAIQAASTRDIGDLNARTEAQIAALDRGVHATAATAAAIIAIQTKQAADRLAIIQKNEADITAATEAAVAARAQSLRATGVAEKQIAAETAKIRIDALAPILAQYQAHYNSLVQLAQGHKAKLDSIEQERVSFNEGIEKQLFDIRLQSLSGLDQYAAKVKEIDRLISEARRAGVEGDIQSAKKFTDQAIALSGTLREVVNKDGDVLVRASEAQQKALDLTKKAADGYRGALKAAQDIAATGFDETSDSILEVLPKLKDLQATYDALKKTIGEGLDVEVRLDEKSVSDALRTIEQLTAPRTLQIKVEPVQPSSLGGPIVAPGFAAGGTVSPIPAPVSNVIDAVQRFAGGGSVFRRPAWSKVPGVGSHDTVPAALQPGSFVIRKSASQFYGDGLLARLARGFAGGGNVFTGSSPFVGGGKSFYDNFFAKANPGGDFFGDVRAGTTQSVRDVGQIAAPKLPSDPRVLLRAVLQYAADVVIAARPESHVFGRTVDELNATLREYERRPDEDTLMRALQLARAIGLNIGVSTGNLRGFDIDGRRWHKEPIGNVDLFHALGFSPLAASYHFFNRGGTTDTVPAMLTPGEFVINPKAVDRYGGGFMQAINNMTLPRAYLENVLNFAPPRPGSPGVARFAEGGAVGNAVASAPRSWPAMASGGTTHNHTWNIGVVSDPENFVRRHVIPVLDQIDRRSGKKRTA